MLTGRWWKLNHRILSFFFFFCKGKCNEDVVKAADYLQLLRNINQKPQIFKPKTALIF